MDNIEFLKSYVSLDIETDGFSKDAKIAEIGAVRIQDGYIIDSLHLLVYPGCKLFLKTVSGFSEGDLSGAVSLPEALVKVISFVGTSTVVGANPSFDIRIINQKSDDLCGPEFAPAYIDIIKIAKQLVPDLPHHTLNDLIRHFDIADRQVHRAYVDAEHTARVYESLKSLKPQLVKSNKVIELPIQREPEADKPTPNEGAINPYQDVFPNTGPRYTVETSLATTRDGEEKSIPIILDRGIPCVAINRIFTNKALVAYCWTTTRTYSLCAFLNFLDDNNIEYENVTMGTIYQYILGLRTLDDKRHGVIRQTIEVIADMYESLALFNYPLDESLFKPYSVRSNTHAKRNSSQSLTRINGLKKEFTIDDRDTEIWTNYQKWYSKEEIEAIAEALSPVYRCIFLISVFSGYRIGSILSIKINTINLAKRQIWPTHLKTKIQPHVAIIPKFVVDELQAYIDDIRIKYDDGSTDALFLSQRKKPTTYQAYYKALQRAHTKVCAVHPDWDLKEFHTHAGRSTFAAALRTYQLSERRAGRETFSDADFCTLMDWKSLDCLHNYDLATRAQELSPLVYGFHKSYYDMTDCNRILSKGKLPTTNASKEQGGD